MKCEDREFPTPAERAAWRKEAISQAIQDMEARIANESKKAEAKARSLSLQFRPDPFEESLKMFPKPSGFRTDGAG